MFEVSSVCAFASFEEVTKLFEREFRAANVLRAAKNFSIIAQGIGRSL
jgi:hypothetical protein